VTHFFSHSTNREDLSALTDMPSYLLQKKWLQVKKTDFHVSHQATSVPVD